MAIKRLSIILMILLLIVSCSKEIIKFNKPFKDDYVFKENKYFKMYLTNHSLEKIESYYKDKGFILKEKKADILVFVDNIKKVSYNIKVVLNDLNKDFKYAIIIDISRTN